MEWFDYKHAEDRIDSECELQTFYLQSLARKGRLNQNNLSSRIQEEIPCQAACFLPLSAGVTAIWQRLGKKAR